jgi:hypothetical protein
MIIQNFSKKRKFDKNNSELLYCLDLLHYMSPEVDQLLKKIIIARMKLLFIPIMKVISVLGILITIACIIPKSKPNITNPNITQINKFINLPAISIPDDIMLRTFIIFPYFTYRCINCNANCDF